MLTTSFDPASLSAIARMFGFSVLLSEEMAVAMKQAGDIITAAAQANTQTAFQNPTGALASSIAPVLTSPYELQVGVGVPYGARLEYGFVGADVLGRVYDEAPEPYLQPAMDANEQAILQLFDVAAMAAWSRVGGA